MAEGARALAGLTEHKSGTTIQNERDHSIMVLLSADRDT
jgi:hypothetical protein